MSRDITNTPKTAQEAKNIALPSMLNQAGFGNSELGIVR